MVTIEELKAKIESGESYILPIERGRSRIIGVRIMNVLKDRVLTSKEVGRELGYGKVNGTLRTLEKDGLIKAIVIKGDKLTYYVLTKDFAREL